MKKKRKIEELNYWDTLADGMIGLLLCVLLILLLVILYLVSTPYDENVDAFWGNRYNDHDAYYDPGAGYDNTDPTEHTEYTYPEETHEDWDNGGGGGDDDDGGEGWNSHEYDDPDPGAGEGEGTDRAAVLVQVVDQETGRTIKKQGLTFELYGSNSSLQVLSTYYPKHIDYKQYETDASGIFYLPEKIELGSYSLHSLSALEGYETTDYTVFTADYSYDWDDPLVVTVLVQPAKNRIRMQLLDQDNGQAVGNASFDVIAAEDIITQDGTIRFREGEVADTIHLDENGYGESKELYLGEYLLRQKTTPAYYAKIKQDIPATITGQTDAGDTRIQEVLTQQTQIQVVLKDALYDTLLLQGAKFQVSVAGTADTQIVETDASGSFTIRDLQQNRTYRIQQLSTQTDYQLDKNEYTFTVNGDGLIDGQQTTTLEVKNRIIRVSIGVQDMLFRGQVSDVNVVLQNAQGAVLQVWNSTGLAQTVEGLAPGEYIVLLGGSDDQTYTIEVSDKTDLQQFQFSVWTTADIGAILAVALLLIGSIAFVIIFRKKSKQSQ